MLPLQKPSDGGLQQDTLRALNKIQCHTHGSQLKKESPTLRKNRALLFSEISYSYFTFLYP